MLTRTIKLKTNRGIVGRQVGPPHGNVNWGVQNTPPDRKAVK